jgi:hypothetical protein
MAGEPSRVRRLLGREGSRLMNIPLSRQLKMSVTPSNKEYYATVQNDARTEQSTSWTVNKQCRPGDIVLLYVCAPISSVVAYGTIVSIPTVCNDASNPWFGHHFADIEELRLLKIPIERKRMRQQFYDWRYWKQPRQPILVPTQYVDQLWDFVTFEGEPIKPGAK